MRWLNTCHMYLSWFIFTQSRHTHLNGKDWLSLMWQKLCSALSPKETCTDIHTNSDKLFNMIHDWKVAYNYLYICISIYIYHCRKNCAVCSAHLHVGWVHHSAGQASPVPIYILHSWPPIAFSNRQRSPVFAPSGPSTRQWLPIKTTSMWCPIFTKWSWSHFDQWNPVNSCDAF